MVLLDETFDSVSQDVTKHHLELTALIQDIQQCTGPLEYLNDLNAEGRAKIAVLRTNIEKLGNLAECERDKQRRTELLSIIDSLKGQLTSALVAFKKANILSANAIEEKSREELLGGSEEQQGTVRKRKEWGNVAKESSRLTDKLLEISRSLAEANERSGVTLDALITSSDTVKQTNTELEDQQQVFAQSGKLLGKYGRREITDKALLALAFMFFLACVFYILQKRLF
ncbi:vesicle transport protein SEC20 [Copidosoma floridanum]|uniref:vesicle transport protein SEC20 n=1 Tax=Copidosoma floridanum TaxID=29053 RepID=UPI0006C9AB6D|nr:vesicle transport protein SEC20 [Copidosoma floridanum]